MNVPKISIILPVYNGGRYLAKAIESILNQTYSDYELIIINDGSTDNTEKIILSYSDPRIRYYKNKTNLKLIKTLNKGIDLAKAKFIARMDADDIALPSLLEKELEIFESNNEIDIVSIRNYLLSDDGSNFYESKTVLSLNDATHKYIVFFQNHISHPGMMIKAQLLKKYKYTDDISVQYFEDVDLWYRLLRDGYNIFIIRERLLFYRKTQNGIVSTHRYQNIQRRLHYCKMVLKENNIGIFDDESIKMLIGDFSLSTLKKMFKLNKQITNYIKKLKFSSKISKTVYNDLIYWRIYSLFLISVISILNNKLSSKISNVLYLAINLPFWILKKKFRKKIFVLIKNRSLINTT